MNLSKFDEVIRVDPFYAKLETDGFSIQFETRGGTKEIKDYKGDIRCEREAVYPIEKDFRDFAEKMLHKYGHVGDVGDGDSRTFVVWSNVEWKFVESVGASGIFYADNINNAFQFPDEESARECASNFKDAVVLQWM